MHIGVGGFDFVEILDVFGNPHPFFLLKTVILKFFQLQNPTWCITIGTQVVSVSDELKILVAGLT